MQLTDQLYGLAGERLLTAYRQGLLGHGSRGTCATAYLLGGPAYWLETIDPLKGTIDHRVKLKAPRTFARGLRQIEAGGFTVQEVILLEAWYAGRIQDERGLWLATLDEDTDPDGGLGLQCVLAGLRRWADFRRRTAVSSKKPYLYPRFSQHISPAEVSRS